MQAMAQGYNKLNTLFAEKFANAADLFGHFCVSYCFNIDDVEDNKDSHSSDALFSISSTLECYMIYTYASTNCMLIDIL